MIITRLTGGLGNQMFQYAAGLALAEHRRTVLKVDISWFRETSEWANHGRYGLDGFLLPAHFSTQEENERAVGVALTRSERASLALARLLRFRQYKRRLSSSRLVFRPGTFRYTTDFSLLPDGTYLDGLFQSELFFKPSAAEVRRHFTFRFPLSPPAETALAEIRATPSAFVHVRRGDYVSHSQFSRELGVLTTAYYQAAIARLLSLQPSVKLHVFSDDPAGAQALLHGVADFTLVDPDRRLSVHETLQLMASCDHAVVANSSYSWWAAWLIGNPQKTVIAPSPWYAGENHDTTDVIPSEWIRQSALFEAPQT